MDFLARACLTAVFCWSVAADYVGHFSATAGHLDREGIPYARAVLATSILFVGVAVYWILTGRRGQIGATMLAAFLILVTILFHDFWTFEDPSQRAKQHFQFFKNLAILGGLLLLIVRRPRESH
jgi:putative oxidoreductase